MSANDMRSLWDAVLTDADMSGKFSALFDAFWKSTKLVSVKDNIYTIEVKNSFAKNQFEKKYEDDVRELLKKNGAAAPRVNFITGSTHTKHQPEYRDDVVIIDDDKPNRYTYAEPAFVSHLNPKYRFDNFIVGSCNDLAYAAAKPPPSTPVKSITPSLFTVAPGLVKPI